MACTSPICCSCLTGDPAAIIGCAHTWKSRSFIGLGSWGFDGRCMLGGGSTATPCSLATPSIIRSLQKQSRARRTGEAAIGCSHEAACLLMAYRDGPDALALPQRLHQVDVLLPCVCVCTKQCRRRSLCDAFTGVPQSGSCVSAAAPAGQWSPPPVLAKGMTCQLWTLYGKA